MADNPVAADTGPPTSREQPAIEIDSDRMSDEGYQSSTTSSLLSSVATEIKAGRVKHGRVFANYGKHEYGLPIDEEELDRLDMNHQKYLLLLGGKIYLAPLPAHMDTVLDIGTGTGIWAIDMADLFPGTSIIGTDIAPVQPQWVPPNCQFQLDDAEQDWTFAPASVDYVHSRDMYQGIRDWPRLARQAYAALKPGGHVEWCSIHPFMESDDGSLPDEAAIVELASVFESLTVRYGCDPMFCKKWQGQLEDAGFVDVTVVVYKIPTSPWAKDPTMKKIGAFEYLNVCEGAEGFLINKYSEWIGKSMEDLQMLVMRLRRELALNRYHCYAPFYTVYGRKPE